MDPDVALALACLVITALVALPALQAVRRRRASRESSAMAATLVERAGVVDEEFLARLRRLDIPDSIPFEFARQFGVADPALLAGAAHRLALRLKRRVAFERKMLARTASGRRRGAIAAAAPGATMLGLRLADVVLPLPLMALLLAVEAFGCWLLWRVARVEV
ncbi:MAG TPA: hypothetical protein VJP84_07320 [Steroidobacteraceae bacterium]|jgi:hypothetical protein|nr:hypothetical protein [Steroidobacteraceae bacterium]